MFLNQIRDVFSNQRIVLGMISKMKTRHMSEPATLLKRGSNTGVFLWLMRFFWEHLLWKISTNGCFWKFIRYCYFDFLKIFQLQCVGVLQKVHIPESLFNKFCPPLVWNVIKSKTASRIFFKNFTKFLFWHLENLAFKLLILKKVV